MALSELNPITKAKYDRAKFPVPPKVRIYDTPDPRALPELGGWKRIGQNVMHFKLTSYPDSTARVSISTEAKTLDVHVRKTTRPSFDVTYWEVNTDTDTSAQEWTLNFDIYIGEPIVPPTGKWLFSKGRVEV
jgi:hypothetical protein